MNRRIVAVLELIHSRYQERLTLRTIAEASGLNPQYFIRRFHAAVGRSPVQYMLEYRLKQARMHLEQGMGIRETALAVGFSDGKIFSNAFKKHEGLSPTAFQLGHYFTP